MLQSMSNRTAKATLSSVMTKSSILVRRRSMSSIPWATMDPKALGTTAEPYAVPNIVDGKLTSTSKTIEIIHPLDRDAYPIFTVPDTQTREIQPFLDSLRKVTKSGMHNPLKNPERYLDYGEISRKVSTKPLPSPICINSSSCETRIVALCPISGERVVLTNNLNL